MEKVIDYLESVSQYIYMTENGKYQTVVKKGKEYHAYKNGVSSKIDVDKYIEWYGNNTKNVIKHMLFPPHCYDSGWGYSKGTKLKSVRYNKYLHILINDGLKIAKAFKVK